MQNFRIAHLSDLHAGYKATKLVTAQGINLREADGYVALSKMVGEVIESEVKVVVISGDIFHVPTPDIRTIIFVQNQLRRFWGAGVAVYMLAGNHDTNDVKADIAASRLLHDPQRKIYSHIEPYAKHEVYDGVHLHMVSHHMYSEQSATMSQIFPVPGEINIFATHGSVIDPILEMKLHTEQSPREIVIPDFLFDDHEWDYAMLGHIHERGWVGSRDGKTDTLKKKVYYNGSLIRRGFSDKECHLGRGWTLWTIDSDGNFTADVREIAQRPQVDFPIIDCKGKTSQQISDEIVANLKSSQVDGINFDPRSAPILRQRISNIENAKRAALDHAAIHNNSLHSMQWSIKPISAAEITNDDIATSIDENAFDSSDVVKVYDEWVKGSEVILNTDELLRAKVQQQARSFVELGQEVTLND